VAAIALHKLHRQVEYHTAAKRSVSRESTDVQDRLLGLPVEAIAQEPTPPEAAAVVDELDHVMQTLRPRHRHMVELRLQGYLFAEIAAATSRSERMVRLVLEQVKAELVKRWSECTG
jgi:DNA-directed RNA polymerase specialized sigma24 family protein